MSRNAVRYGSLWERLIANTAEPINGQGCWLWTGACDRHGYARISSHVPGVGKRSRMAHIVLWELLNGPVPRGFELDHICAHGANGYAAFMSRRCINPDHLDPATKVQNAANRRRTSDEPIQRA